MENKQKIIKFEDVKDQILIELQKRAKAINIEESVSLLDGFLNEPLDSNQ